MSFFKKIAAVACAVVAAQAMAQHVEISSGGHTTGAKEQSLTYRGVCDGAPWNLEFDRAGKKVLFRPDEAAGPIDLSNTAFGKTFRDGLLYGRFGLGCNVEGFAVTFVGYQTMPKTAPKPVFYKAIISKTGEFAGDSGLQETDPGLLEVQPVGQ